ncbi:YuzF family protein [Peribacillus frigoritolerans]|uniref:YuzF family protein n=1 Tax=Peribacillus frigoritolerans TaxID=450367 RepID=UPI002225DFA4|nr:YuzF family protein [Peribacillus frigoritolerans]UYY98162.1 YuzF family protein [Peribacillus frigoritolerans]
MKKQNFQEALHSLIGFNVSIISDDKTVHDGVVLDVKSDFIVIQMNPDKPCYFNLNQVYALSKNTKEFQAQMIDHEPTQKQSFTELINELKGNWVTVKRDNNLTFDGFLSTVTNNYIVLINKDKQLYVQLSNILYIFNGIDNKESSDNKQQENKDEKTESKQSEGDQAKESDSKLMEDAEVNSKEKEEPVEQKQEQAILTIGKEEQPLSTEISALPEVLSFVKEEPVEQKQEQAILTIGKEGPALPTERSTHPEVLSDVREEPTVQSSVNEVNKNQSNVKKSTNKYKKQKSTEKKKKSKKEKASETNPEISAHPEVLSNVREEPTFQSTVNEVNKDQSNVIKKSADKKYKKQKSREKKKKEGKKEMPSETNKKNIQGAIQENLTEVFRESSPQEMNEQSAKKNDLKEKRKLIDKKCYELMKSTEKMNTDNGNQKNEYYSLTKFAERMHGKLKAKRSKP